MAEQRNICLRTDELAPDLALGLLTGSERADALAHVAACTACRSEVDRLAVIADRLVLLAPAVEPPARLEAAVLAGMSVRDSGAPRRLRWATAAAACLVALAAVGVAVGVAQPRPAHADQADMLTPSGRDVGDIEIYGRDPAWLLVSVPRWRRWDEQAGRPLSYALRVQLVDGRRVKIAGLDLTREGAWGAATTLDPSMISSVSIVDDSGHVWCTGRLA